MIMWSSSNADISTRSEFEISAAALKNFCGATSVTSTEKYFDGALDAIVTGCVKEYSFNEDDMNFEGVVTSFDGNESYQVKIYVTEDFEIESAFCSCPEDICHHIGALALHSGFKTPLFSYLPQKRTVSDDKMMNGGDVECVEDKSDKKDDEFVIIKNINGFTVETYATDWNPKRSKSSKPRVKVITTRHICLICDKMYADPHQLKMHEAKQHHIAADKMAS